MIRFETEIESDDHANVFTTAALVSRSLGKVCRLLKVPFFYLTRTQRQGTQSCVTKQT